MMNPLSTTFFLKKAIKMLVQKRQEMVKMSNNFCESQDNIIKLLNVHIKLSKTKIYWINYDIAQRKEEKLHFETKLATES